MYIIKSPDYTKPGHLQSNHVTGKLHQKYLRKHSPPLFKTPCIIGSRGARELHTRGERLGPTPDTRNMRPVRFSTLTTTGL